MLAAIATLVLSQQAHASMRSIAIHISYFTFDRPIKWDKLPTAFEETKESDTMLPQRLGSFDGDRGVFAKAVAGKKSSLGHGFNVVSSPILRTLEGMPAAIGLGSPQGPNTLRVKATSTLKDRNTFYVEIGYEPRNVDLDGTMAFTRKAALTTSKCLVLGFLPGKAEDAVQAITVEILPDHS